MKKGSINPHLYKARVGNCIICGKEYRAVKDFKERKQKYCSKECYRLDWSKRIQLNIKRAVIVGDKNHSWKGDKVGYWGIHRWIKIQRGTPIICEHCGTETARKYEWANKDHKYKRILTDYMRLCTKCHRKYDYKFN